MPVWRATVDRVEGRMILFWRRVDVTGLERLDLSVGDGEVSAVATVLCLEGSGFRLDYEWLLDGAWRTRRLDVEQFGPTGRRNLTIERTRSGWSVDGTERADLSDAEEPDLSVTPFCNTLPIRRLDKRVGAERTLDTVYVDGGDLSVVRSRQRYVRKADDVVRYVDLGTAKGFEADLHVDPAGFVRLYQGLFERVGAET